MSEHIKCTVRDGKFVEPCGSLSANTDHSSVGKAKGVACWQYSNMATLEPSRTFFGVKTKAHPNGMLFNFCPWCGEDISEPFSKEEGTDA